MTVLAYFNSLRELGGARRIVEEEVQNTLKEYGARRRVGEAHGPFRDRRTFSEIVELTSRVFDRSDGGRAAAAGPPVSRTRSRRLRDCHEHDLGGPRHSAAGADGGAGAAQVAGGLVQQARSIEEHLAQALGTAALCSNDPVCAWYDSGRSLEERWLHGAACHGCALVAETSCEMRNDYLDRALVVPVIGVVDAAFFEVT